eukprot:6304229-Heterocapsa_arctica.AAC.1
MEFFQTMYDIHELDGTTKYRQVVQHATGSQCRRSETVEQDGGSEDPKEQAAGVRQIKRSNAKRMADHGEHQSQWQRKQSGIHCVQGPGKQE